MNDPIANLMSTISNCERVGKNICVVRPNSKITINILEIMKANNYIESFKIISESEGGYIEVVLSGNINNCNVIKPRFSVKVDEFEKFEKRFLPNRNLGIIIVSTPLGLMTHKEAIEKNTGGTLIAYCY